MFYKNQVLLNDGVCKPKHLFICLLSKYLSRDTGGFLQHINIIIKNSYFSLNNTL